MISAEQIERAVQARRNIDAAEENARQARATLAELKAAERSEEIERERLRKEKLQDDARRLIDGEGAVPQKTRRDNRLLKLDGDAAARAAAIQIQENRVADAEAVAAAVRAPLIAAILEALPPAQISAVEQARECLASVAPALAHLIAIDQISAATIGERYAVPRGAMPPFCGLTVVRNLVKALPDRLRPAEMNEDRLFEAANEISNPIIQQIKGN